MRALGDDLIHQPWFEWTREGRAAIRGARMIFAALLGLAFGFVGSIPIAGPISALVLKRGLAHRYASAALIGVGGALAEGIYAFLAFWGFSSYLTVYPWIEPVSRCVAAIILAGLGISFIRYHGAKEVVEKRDPSLPRSFGIGFTITLLNPTLLATWAATTTAVYSSSLFTITPAHALPFAAGATTGIATWFVLFSLLMKRYKSRFQPTTLEKIVRGVGVALLGLSLWFGYRFVEYFLVKHS